MATALLTGPNYLLTCFDVSSGSSVDHASGGVGGVLASLYYGERVLGQLLPNNTSMLKYDLG